MNDRLDLQTLTATIMRRWMVVLLVTAGIATLGYVVSKKQTPTFEATTSVLVAQDPPGIIVENSDRALKEQLALTFAELAVRSPVLEPAAQRLGLADGWRSLRSRVAVKLAPKTLLLDIIVTDSSPEEAARAADVVAEELVRVSTPYSEFVQEQVGDARADPDPVSPNIRMNTLFAGIIGFIVASALALMAELVRVRRRRAFRALDDIPFLGVVRLRRRSPSPLDLDAASSEEAGAILSNLQVACRPRQIRSLLVIGSSEPDRNRVTMQLAATYAQGGDSTVIVDLGLRDPSIHLLASTGLSPGVADLLESRSPRRAFTRTVRPNLRVLPSGRATLSPSMLLSADAPRRISDSIDPAAHVIVFDLPLTERLAEIGLVAEQVDACVLVVQNRLTRASERRAGEELAALGARPNGVIVVQHSFLSRLMRPPIVEAPADDAFADADEPPTVTGRGVNEHRDHAAERNVRDGGIHATEATEHRATEATEATEASGAADVFDAADVFEVSEDSVPKRSNGQRAHRDRPVVAKANRASTHDEL